MWGLNTGSGPAFDFRRACRLADIVGIPCTAVSAMRRSRIGRSPAMGLNNAADFGLSAKTDAPAGNAGIG
jgi:hypothetical protein